MSTFSIIVISVIILHLAAGFGWLIYKLSLRKEDKNDEDKPQME